MKVTLYTTHCPKCTTLGQMLENKNIKFETVTDINTMIAKGFEFVPMLEIDGQIMNYDEAKNWVEKENGGM